MRSASEKRLTAFKLLAGLVLLTAGLTPSPARQSPAPAPRRDVKVAAAPDPAEVALVRQAARPLTGSDADYNPLMEMVGDARFVLLGEATHGTHEFYRERARITRRLIEEKGFTAFVLEADWPDAYRVGEYVRGGGEDATAEQALADFRRFPRWMWANTDFRDFAEWLRAHNASRPPESRAGLYGMDLYSVSESAREVVEYLKGVDPEAAKRAKKRYDCFGGYGDRPEQYGYDVAAGARRSCEKEATAQLQEMERRLAAGRARGAGGARATTDCSRPTRTRASSGTGRRTTD